MRTVWQIIENWSGGMTLRVHSLLASSQVNGPGKRAVIWLQGCSLRCPGCWNPETHSRTGGTDLLLLSGEDLRAWLSSLWSQGSITGLTISGGEPLEQAPGLAKLLAVLWRTLPDLSMGLFTGYSEGELDRGKYFCIPPTSVNDRRILWRQVRSCLDFAVLGRYNALQPASAPLVTSKNQRLRLYTRRHMAADFAPQAVEITIDSRGLTQITGFPVRGAVAK